MQQRYQCPKCGAQVAFGVRFCGNCQTPLNWPTQQQSPPQYQQPPPQQPVQTPQYQQQYQQPQQLGGYQQQPGPPKKKTNVWLMGCLGVIVLAVIIGAIALVTSNSSPETSSSTPPASTPQQTPPATFTPIIKSGTGSLTTTPFTITTDEWIIDWSYSTSDPDFAVFGFFIYPRGETEVYTEVVLFPEATSGSTYSYAGPGEYYIKTNVANIDEWEITIRPAN